MYSCISFLHVFTRREWREGEEPETRKCFRREKAIQEVEYGVSGKKRSYVGKKDREEERRKKKREEGNPIDQISFDLRLFRFPSSFSSLSLHSTPPSSHSFNYDQHERDWLQGEKKKERMRCQYPFSRREGCFLFSSSLLIEHLLGFPWLTLDIH